MTEEQAVQILTDIMAPVIGEYLAEYAARKLYTTLVAIDEEALHRLLDLLTVEEERR